jgi:hypothetical protein
MSLSVLHAPACSHAGSSAAEDDARMTNLLKHIYCIPQVTKEFTHTRVSVFHLAALEISESSHWCCSCPWCRKRTPRSRRTSRVVLLLLNEQLRSSDNDAGDEREHAGKQYQVYHEVGHGLPPLTVPFSASETRRRSQLGRKVAAQAEVGGNYSPSPSEVPAHMRIDCIRRQYVVQ